MADVDDTARNETVADSVIPHGKLPPMRFRALPPPVRWTKMVGPSIMLAGLALGSGEFILWPYITYKAGFVFFWACMLGVITQYFLNMEIERWTLATGESAITGFCRLSVFWAWVMLALNIVPWVWPGWATGASMILSWMVWGATEQVIDGTTVLQAQHVHVLGIGSLVLVGVVLTAGPVVYNTVERIQTILVGCILLLVTVIALWVVRQDALVAMFSGMVNIGGMPDLDASGLTLVTLLGALAFAGAGGTTNLGQSNFINDKGYGMGQYVGRITSPVTGQEEAIGQVGFHFRDTPENRSRWRGWWSAANTEHFFSFFLTCVACLCLMSLITYSLLYDADGQLKSGMDGFGGGMDFIWAQSIMLGKEPWGGILRPGFLLMGIAILMTTELGVLDTIARISTDIVKVNFLRDNPRWSLSRLYYCFLWGEIVLGSIILLIPNFDKPLLLLKTSAAMNGGVMFIYSALLVYMNLTVLPRHIRMTPLRFVILLWSCGFFGYFSIQALRYEVLPVLNDWWWRLGT
ncbi:MAG: Nramp family divalent metal transporter [Planctomycetaceae bacterium]